MSSVRKIVRAVNLESKRIEKNFGISIPQLLTLKYLNESPEYRSTMRNLREVLSLIFISFSSSTFNKSGLM